MQVRHRSVRIVLVGLAALLIGAAPGWPAARAGEQAAPTRYIVTLDGPAPGAGVTPAAISAADTARGQALAALGAVVGVPVSPL
jgi:hypothetical protein